MKRKNNIYELDDYNEMNLADFSMWLDDNIHLILSKKQTKIFKKLKMRFEDIKLFGKSTNVNKYYKTNLKDSYEQDSLNWVLNYSVAN
tara:strand:+ start:185 stop:448 length:264 start_codon:yes stop_codon:yes gene_type:complete